MHCRIDGLRPLLAASGSYAKFKRVARCQGLLPTQSLVCCIDRLKPHPKRTIEAFRLDSLLSEFGWQLLALV